MKQIILASSLALLCNANVEPGSGEGGCKPLDPSTCPYSSEGGCCMTYVLNKAPGELDRDWRGAEVGDVRYACVSYHEMDFLYEYGKGEHSVFDNNKFYYEHVDH